MTADLESPSSPLFSIPLPETPPPLVLDGNTTMGEILKQHPAARVALFQRFHIGGCSACGYDPEETLSGVLLRNRVDVKQDLPSALDLIRRSADIEADLHCSPASLEEERARGLPIHLIDVRSEEEFLAGHLDSALLLTTESSFEILDSWPKDSLLVCYSGTGDRSLHKASWFRAYGMTRARSLDGGYQGWKQRRGEEGPGLIALRRKK